MLFLNLNDGYSSINGRDLIIDIANNTRGKNNNQRNSNNNNNYYQRRNNDINNISSNLSDIDGNKFRGGLKKGPSANSYRSNNTTSAAAPPPAERRTLKLAPRSKAVESANRSSSQSSIFGDAKPRDEESWRKKKEEMDSTVAVTDASSNAESGKKEEVEENIPTAEESTSASVPVDDVPTSAATTAGTVANPTTTVENPKDNNRQNNNGDRRGSSSGRGGGRGRGRAGRGSGGGRGRNNRRNSDRTRNNRNSQQGGKDADGWDEAKGGPSLQKQAESKMPVVEKKESKPVKASNKFAAFLDDSDSESD